MLSLKGVRPIQPRPRLERRPVPSLERIDCGFPVYHVTYRYSHHAGPSGYDRLTDYLGEVVEVGRLRHLAGETIFRLPALWNSKRGGVLEYSRYDWVLEQEAMALMRRTSGSLFHFLYGDKNYKRACSLAGRNGNRMVATIHHPPEHFPRLFRSTEHFRHLDCAIAVSEGQRAFLNTIVDHSKVAVVHYAVDTRFFRPAADEERSPTPVCLFAGSHERDLDLLPTVVRGVLSRVKGAAFVLASNDPRCAEIARSQPHTSLAIRLDDDAYAALLRRAWLLVLPLRMSTTSTVVLEAMASGLPAITTHGGISEYVTPDGGVLCPPGDADAMIEATCHLLEDAGRLIAAQAAARRQAERFAWPVAARRTAELYQQVMSE